MYAWMQYELFLCLISFACPAQAHVHNNRHNSPHGLIFLNAHCYVWFPLEKDWCSSLQAWCTHTPIHPTLHGPTHNVFPIYPGIPRHISLLSHDQSPHTHQAWLATWWLLSPLNFVSHQMVGYRIMYIYIYIYIYISMIYHIVLYTYNGYKDP